jgi:hypothetical protein
MICITAYYKFYKIDLFLIRIDMEESLRISANKCVNPFISSGFHINHAKWNRKLLRRKLDWE